MVRRQFVLMMCITATACTESASAPKSLCDSREAAGSSKQMQVRWSGVIEGGFNHGFTLFDEDCGDRFIKLAGVITDNSKISPLEKELQERSTQWGLMHVDVTGQVTDGRTLQVSKVHSFRFEPMSEQQKTEWWRRSRRETPPDR